jgi:hypothetical protein
MVETAHRVGQRNVLCYQCNTVESYMVNLNEIKCRTCGSEAVEFVKKGQKIEEPQP